MARGQRNLVAGLGPESDLACDTTLWRASHHCTKVKHMPIIDTPIRAVRDRTPRELLLLALVAYGAYLSYGFWPEFITATGVALLFALRVPQARPIAVGFCLGWLVSMAAMMHGQQWDLTNVRILIPAVLLFLLSSRDLFARFDAAPARFIPNVWRDLPTKHWRMMRWCAYSLGVLSALVVPGWLWAAKYLGASSVAPTLVVVGIVLALALLVVGSALGFVLAAAVSAFTLLENAPSLFAQDASAPLRQGMLGPVCGAALAVLVLSMPYCVRLLRPR